MERKEKMEIRRYRHEDAEGTYRLLYETVHEINKKDYTLQQLDAWAPKEFDLNLWDARLSSFYTLVAWQENPAGGEEMLGFANINDQGYLDYMFVNKEKQNQKVATSLLYRLQEYALKQGNSAVWAQVSVTARPFFEKRGFGVEKEQTVECRGQKFLNYRMRRKLENQTEKEGDWK